jgi:hypothetical protein
MALQTTVGKKTWVIIIKNINFLEGMVEHTWSPSTREAEMGGSLEPKSPRPAWVTQKKNPSQNK